MIEFKDRRPKQSVNVKLTPRQRELANNFDIGEADERGHITLTPHDHRRTLEAAWDMMDESEDWGPEHKGVRQSAKNLTKKINSAINSAVVDNCPACRGGLGCGQCLGSRKRIR